MNDRRPARKLAIRPLEALDARIVPSGLDVVVAKGGATLGAIYQEYLNFEQSGGTGTFAPSEAGRIYFKGTSVEVDLRFGSGDFGTLIDQLQGIGMQVSATAPLYHLVEGYLPIARLPMVLSNSHEAGIMPVYKPTLRSPIPTPVGLSTSTPLSKAAGPLNIIDQEYASYAAAGAQGAFVTSQTRVDVAGTSVGVDIRVNGGDIGVLADELRGIGMKVSAVNSAYGIIEGSLPIAQLPTVNRDSHVIAILAVYRADLR